VPLLGAINRAPTGDSEKMGMASRSSRLFYHRFSVTIKEKEKAVGHLSRGQKEKEWIWS
jgi:esterase/lipase superfamily enzyme